MAGAHGVDVGWTFKEKLDQVYGKFESRQLGPHSECRVAYDEANFLRPVKVLSKCLHTQRHAHGLKPEWHEHFFILRQLSGQMRVSLGENAGLLRANDLMLLDDYSAYEFLNARSSECVLIPISYDSVDQPKRVLAACGQRIDGSSGIGQVLSTAHCALTRGPLPDCTADREAMMDAMRILLTRVVERVPTVPRPADGANLIMRAEIFVLTELANPGLNPDTMADAIGVSRRQLYRLFSDHGTTPAAWIWTLRIREARARLESATCAAQSLTQIAFDVGFNDMAHFSRLYRAHYGAAPREHRRLDRGTASQDWSA